MKPFNKQVYDIVEKIPFGKVATYGQIAHMIGRPRMARFVGFASNNTSMHHLPWHRVVFKDGALCPTSSGWTTAQYKSLRAEGITFNRDKKVRMDKHQWSGAIENPNRPDDLKDAPLVF
jgi:methylated-DNA-protein-cysteine methyltransferase-like protein